MDAKGRGMTSRGWFIVLAMISFAVAAFLLLAVLVGRECGVELFSLQVDVANRIMLIAIPAGIPAVLGVLFLYWARKGRSPQER